MKKGYGQYCPLAIAAELLGQRWMILVISRLIDGCCTFNEIHRGVPRISPSLLSQRLGELEHFGLVKRIKQKNKTTFTYQLTQAGRDLENIVMQMAVWGQQWGRDMKLDDLDLAFLAWSMHTRLNTDIMPAGRTVIEFNFTGVPGGYDRFWLVNIEGKVDMCLKYQGFDSDIIVYADLRLFVEAWRGFRDLGEEIYVGHIKLEGPGELKQVFPDWLMLSGLAAYERKRAGKERRLYSETTESKQLI